MRPDNTLVLGNLRKQRRNNRKDRERLVLQLLGWGTNNVLVPVFLAVVFKKQDILQQVVTRMHDLKIIWTLTAGGVPSNT